ncbi:7-carboxy-7-deazaguanine synthase [Poriferisphaera corsica]|uniref:7-carboxy-7-deazaguanine synthase n=1 Tax=Poriferisphaera corsica TaxID=2528020 RepID=A0A517YU40_9BACT|nr:radical SAM protein [Poriferisphaera corsica]QDU33709.1 7-carboxy-7-deazaguanine synthase [Poriferisphaera corsica]
MTEATCRINEIFYSVQGESTWTGERCVFIRLSGCHLRCNYCDTEYAFREGSTMTHTQIHDQVRSMAPSCNLIEITGGEPLLQKSIHPLMTQLIDAGNTVLIETSGACDISTCDPRVIRIMDIKTPGSGESHRNDWNNIQHLNQNDEVKFVICDRVDYEWARNILEKYDLSNRAKAVLFSAAGQMPKSSEIQGIEGLNLRQLTDWVLQDNLPVKLQIQLHKIIWDPAARGV